MIVTTQKMDVVRRGQAEAKVFRNRWKHRVAPPLLVHPVIVQLDEKIFGAQNVTVFGGGLLRLVDVVRLNR